MTLFEDHDATEQWIELTGGSHFETVPLENLTPYQAKYIAYDLTRRHAPDSLEKLAGALVDAQVDLNPHQLDAALFAFQSPLSKGALLADEVGLGKTIEAGLVISQKWAERKRRILVVTPANLRKQWYQELSEKFFLPCRILEAKSYNAQIKVGKFRPFEAPEIVICSYQFAKSKAGDVNAIPWDLVVIDEAHRLRNVYKPTNVIANVLKQALANAPKLLLTATPLQNSLLELFGLVSFIDEHAFGDLKSFKEQYAKLDQDRVFQTLKARLKPLCHRTLRRQVLAYVKYTKRLPIVQPFTPEEGEDRLYTLVSDYLRRDNLQALPNSQRTLMTLVLRKLLASSTFAIAGALDTLIRRMRLRIAKDTELDLLEELDEDYEALGETAEEWEDGEPDEPLTPGEIAALEREIKELESFRDLAVSITSNAKGRALIEALNRAFAEADRLGAARKAIIFTESRKTQSYLLRLLADSPWRDGIVLFNGSNTDDKAKSLYAQWADRHAGTDKVTGSRTADMRSALTEYFRDEGQIMIATEAGAEGINLQFCSLVVNYDLPWNPQRIEQRIGRCHRYGQKHDVVVVNFLNQTNEADQRVFALLSEKFQLFEGVFGASDEVLGAIESGVDFEKRIADIYQRCRHPDEIEHAFDSLQRELSGEIDATMTKTRQQLMENFDDEVREKLKISDEASRAFLNRYERLLMLLTRYELDGHAEFRSDSAFELKKSPFPGIPTGLYELPRRTGDAHTYRMTHPLAEALIDRAKEREAPPATVTFHYGKHDGKVSILEPHLGKAGTLRVALLTVDSPAQSEDHLILAAFLDTGAALDEETTRRLLSLPGTVDGILPEAEASALAKRLDATTEERAKAILAGVSERTASYFDQEIVKLDAWADDQRLALKRTLRDLDDQIVALRKEARHAGNLPDKLAIQRRVTTLEAKRDQSEAEAREAAREIERRKNELLDDVERRLRQTTRTITLIDIQWRLVE